MERIVLMGTPQFAVPTLEMLIENFNLVGVVTQPDRPRGRGKKLGPPPAKIVAVAHGIPVLQPQTLRDPEAVARLAALEPDLIITAAFGQILRAEVLNLPPRGVVNVHASLLPRWRGAAPVAAAIRAGDRETGVTLMQTDEGMDTGPILVRRAVPIRPDHVQGALAQELAQVGADLLRETLPRLFRGELTPQPQDDALATLAPRLKKEDGRIDWAEPALAIERQVRAFDPWPGTFTTWRDESLKILKASAQNVELGQEPPGKVFVPAGRKAVWVATGQGVLQLLQVQTPGKRPMPPLALANGAPDFIGAVLG
ncbi:MAG: methionyl-tRNA formyltransferase [Anaerolineae bacterium]